ncbi:YjzC family protein [Tepidibacillus marianensis]|uniref:YjzC family protein n=1 Tax=Tepidibacillus marianensis TaxID=3131995 RepID=UPI0030D0D3FB
MSELYKPGQKPKDSGQFKEVRPKGGQVSNTEITGVEGKPLPPTSKQGNKWAQVDKTKHKK